MVFGFYINYVNHIILQRKTIIIISCYSTRSVEFLVFFNFPRYSLYQTCLFQLGVSLVNVHHLRFEDKYFIFSNVCSHLSSTKYWNRFKSIFPEIRKTLREMLNVCSLIRFNIMMYAYIKMPLHGSNMTRHSRDTR